MCQQVPSDDLYKSLENCFCRCFTAQILSYLLLESVYVVPWSLLSSLSPGQEMDLNWPECQQLPRLHTGSTGPPAARARVSARWASREWGQLCACATRDKNIGELETCTAGDYHMLAVIKTSSRNLWLANTGLTLNTGLPSSFQDFSLCFPLMVTCGVCTGFWPLVTITIKYSPEQMLIINCTLTPRAAQFLTLPVTALPPPPQWSQYRPLPPCTEERLPALWSLHCSLAWMSAQEN